MALLRFCRNHALFLRVVDAVAFDAEIRLLVAATLDLVPQCVAFDDYSPIGANVENHCVGDVLLCQVYLDLDSFQDAHDSTYLVVGLVAAAVDGSNHESIYELVHEPGMPQDREYCHPTLASGDEYL